MKVTIIQTQLIWENRERNLEHFTSLINSISENTDLIVLPEMFTTGFTMNPEVLAEKTGGSALDWMKERAVEKSAVITGSIAVEETGKYYNRLYWVSPDGECKTYDKRHLFRMAKEDQHYTPGREKIIVSVKNWNICPLICYDLRFPVFSRNRFLNGKWDYDVLIYVANWPEVRAYAWKQLLIARAIENQCYVIGLNRIGDDGNSMAHSGDSVVINPKGEIISKTPAGKESIETLDLDYDYLTEFRKNFPAGLDADSFTLI